MRKWDKKKRLWILGTGKREKRIAKHLKNLEHYFEINLYQNDPRDTYRTGYAMAIKTIIICLFDSWNDKPEEAEEAIRRFAEKSLKAYF